MGRGSGGSFPQERCVLDRIEIRTDGPTELARAGVATAHLPLMSNVDDAMLQQFREQLKAATAEYTDKEFTDNLEWVKANIKADLFTSQFGQSEGMKIRAGWDPQITKALTFMPEAQALENHTLPSQQKTQTAEVRK